MLSTARCSAVPMSPPRRVPYWPVRSWAEFRGFDGMAAYCSVPLRAVTYRYPSPRRAPYWPVQTVSAGGFPKARFTLLVWQCSVWHRSLLGVTLSFPLASTLRPHHTASLGSITCCHSLLSLTGIPATVQYCSILSVRLQYLQAPLQQTGNRLGGWCRLLMCTAVGRSDTPFSAMQYSTDGLFIATHRT